MPKGVVLPPNQEKGEKTVKPTIIDVERDEAHLKKWAEKTTDRGFDLTD